MWTRKELKEKAKKAFSKNYWKCVLCAIIFGIFVGGASGGFSGGYGGATGGFASSYSNYTNQTSSSETSDNDVIDIEGVDVDADVVDGHIEITDEDGNKVPTEGLVAAGVAFIIVMVIVFAIIMLVATAIGFVVQAFLIKPIEFGIRYFFRRNLDEPANLSCITHSFDKNYMNSVKAGFFSSLFIWLWSFVFVIPGIIKSYEYRLVPYIVSENTEISWKDALKESSRLMKGNKWKTFVLDLSFIGWEILSLLTCGLLGLFYVDPYKIQTDAALYEAIKYGNAPAEA